MTPTDTPPYAGFISRTAKWAGKLRRDTPFYLLALATVTIAAVLRWLLGDVLGSTNYPFFLFHLAVVVCAWYGTLGSSLVCAFLGGLVADYLFVDPKYTVGPSNLQSWLAMITYLVVSISIALFAEAYRRAIQRAEKSGSRLKLALSAGNAATFDWNPETNTLAWSDEYWKIFDLEPAAMPSLQSWLDHIHVQDRQRVLQSLTQIVVLQQEQPPFDFRIVGNGGRQHWVHARLALLRPSGSEKIRVIGAMVDVSDLKKAELALLRSAKLTAAGKLAATVAHEVNNPLEAVTNLLFLARRAAAVEQVKNYLEAADQELARVATAAKRTLAFYKEHSHPAPVDIETVLHSAIENLSHKIMARKITLETHCADRVMVLGVAGELGHAFSNLLANSIEAAPPQGRIVIRAARRRNWRDPARWLVRVSISDNGPGIKLQDREQLFEPFFSTKGAAGTGLGLWMSEEIVRRHAGHIRILTRAEGSRTGTVVCVSLPALAEAGEAGREAQDVREAASAD